MNVLDTGTIIQMLKEKRHKQGFISPITLIETLRGIDSRKRTKIKELLEKSFYLLNIDNEIIEKYCEVYSKLKKEGNLLPDADLLIGATAMAKSIALETNGEHFQRLERLGLKLI